MAKQTITRADLRPYVNGTAEEVRDAAHELAKSVMSDPLRGVEGDLFASAFDDGLAGDYEATRSTDPATARRGLSQLAARCGAVRRAAGARRACPGIRRDRGGAVRVSAPDEVPLSPLSDPLALPEWVRWYGVPSDPYLRVEDDQFRLERGEVRLRRRVIMRPRLGEVSLSSEFGGES